jgi:hypothetical protein
MDSAGAFPALHALADVAALPGARAVRAKPRRPERVQALGLRSNGRARLFLANVTSDPHPVRVAGLAGPARRARLGDTGPGAETGPEVELGPHEIARLDFDA